MKQRSLLIFCLIFGLCGYAAAQSKAVTNADLEKYRQERVRAERDYAENYAKLGLPSPAELAERRERDRVESEKLAAELRNARLAAERAEAERRYAVSYSNPSAVYYPSDNSAVMYWLGGRGYQYPQLRFRQAVRPGYFAGGQFWPTGSATRPRPMWTTKR